MQTLIRSVVGIVFPKVGGRHRISYRYFLAFLLLPIAASVVTFLLVGEDVFQFRNPEVVAGSFGVLGGLLFAHAIFVFQLRVTYDSAQVEPADPDGVQEDLRVRPLIDEMFSGVLYASFVALVLTVSTAAIAAAMDEGAVISALPTALIAGLAAHLVGGVWHVLEATTTAYSVLKKQKR